MSVRLPAAAVLLASALVAGAFPVPRSAGTSSGGSRLIPAAQAQSGAQSPAARAQSAVQTLIALLRGRTMPDGIVKSNGRIEATQVDVSAKYPGRLATLTVDEGDEVMAGQVVGTISDPEVEAQQSKLSSEARRLKYWVQRRRWRQPKRSSSNAIAI